MINKDLQSMDDLEQLVSVQLKELYPLPSTGAVRIDVGKRRQPRRYARSIAAAVATVAVVAAGLGVATTFGQGDQRPAQVPVAPADTPSPSAPSSPSASSSPSSTSSNPTAAPGWVSRCFQKPGKMLAADRAYLGLTKAQALALAKKRGQHLVPLGGGGHCFAGPWADVRIANTVGILFDQTGSYAHEPASGHVIFATSDPDAEYPFH